VVSLIKFALIPGSMPFLIVSLSVGVLLLYSGKRATRWARVWLTSVALLYVVLSVPLISRALIAGLSGAHHSMSDAGASRGARVVAAIGAGAVTYSADGHSLHQLGRRTAFAVLETVRLYQLLNPEWIVTSGGIADPLSQQKPESEIMRDALVTLGVPADRIVLESDSRTTAEQLAGIRRLVTERHFAGPVVLVATPAHARRVMLAARQHGLDAVLSASEELIYGEANRPWFPSLDALRGSESALYEGMAVVYYWLGGLAR
jgi:uncharacterized SAM-binding protein YcdF (DUF218 family)